MNVEQFHDYCLGKKGSEACFPFDRDTLVFKVMGKIFAIVPLEHDVPRANLKARPDDVIALRERHPQIMPGFHMNKSHWNTVLIDDGLDDDMVTTLIDESYDLVVAKLTKKAREELQKI